MPCRRGQRITFPFLLRCICRFLARNCPSYGGGVRPLRPRSFRRQLVLLLRVRRRPQFLGMDGALDFCMTQQELDGAQVAGASVDQGRLRSAQ